MLATHHVCIGLSTAHCIGLSNARHTSCMHRVEQCSPHILLERHRKPISEHPPYTNGTLVISAQTIKTHKSSNSCKHCSELRLSKTYDNAYGNMHPPIHPSIDPSIHTSIHPSTHLSIIHPSNHPPTQIHASSYLYTQMHTHLYASTS